MFFLISTVAVAGSYAPLKNLHWQNCNSSGFAITYNQENLSVDYNFCEIDNYVDFNFVRFEMVKDTESIFRFAESVGVSGSECVQLQKLDVFEVGMDTLNHISIPGLVVKPGNVLWGLYDPRINEKNVASIMFTFHGIMETKIILAHELAHYWFDRLCWNNTWNGDSEQFSQEFEKFYEKEVNK